MQSLRPLSNSDTYRSGIKIFLIHGHNFSYFSYFIKSISHSWSQFLIFIHGHNFSFLSCSQFLISIHGHNFSYLSYFIKSISHSWSQYFSRPSTRSLLRRTTQLSSPSPSRWLDSCSARRATRDHLEIFFGITFWPSCEDKVDGTRSASSQ